MYILAELLGSIFASGTLSLMCDVTPSAYFGTVPVGSSGQSFVAEIIISFLLMFVISGVVTDNRAVCIYIYNLSLSFPPSLCFVVSRNLEIISMILTADWRIRRNSCWNDHNVERLCCWVVLDFQFSIVYQKDCCGYLTHDLTNVCGLIQANFRSFDESCKKPWTSYCEA